MLLIKKGNLYTLKYESAKVLMLNYMCVKERKTIVWIYFYELSKIVNNIWLFKWDI